MANINSFVQNFIATISNTQLEIDPELCENIKERLLGSWNSQQTQDKLQGMNTKTKRSPSAYVLYSNDHRAQVKQDLPDGSKNTDVMCELGKMWKLLTTSTVPADIQTVADYKQKANLQKGTPTEKTTNSKKLVAKTGDVKVKRAKNPYVLYCRDFRDVAKQALPEGHKNTDIMSELGKRWKLLLDSKEAADIELLHKYKVMSQKEKEMMTAAGVSAKPVKHYTEELSECFHCRYHANGGFDNNGRFYCDNCWIVFNGCEDELILRQNTEKPTVDGECEKTQVCEEPQKTKADTLIEELFGSED